MARILSRQRMSISLIMVALLVNICDAAENATPSAIKPRVDHESRWWPPQAMPKALVRTPNGNDFPAPRASSEMMVQSVAGLAAKAVNDGRGDEMVWVGTEKVAREIRRTVESARPNEVPRYDWVIAHAWSWFKLAPGFDDNAEDMPQENAAAQGGVRGYTPVTWCAARLPSNIRTVSPEELIWRIRMKHDPEQTKKQIGLWPR